MLQRVSNRIRRINATLYPEHIFQGPQWLVLGVNNSCNLHCKMCDVGVSFTQSNFYDNLTGSQPMHMPMELFRKIADQAAQFYPNVKLGYAFTEPLIYLHLEESLRYAKSKQLRTTLTTNGLGLRKWAKVLTDTSVAEVNLSLDGPENLHNFIRGNKHSFRMAMEGAESIFALGRDVAVNVFCVITEWNIGHLVEFLSAMNKFPFGRIGLMHSNFTPQHIADKHNAQFGGLYPATSSNVTDTNVSSIDTAALWDEIKTIKTMKWNFEVDFFPEITSLQNLNLYYHHPEIFIGRRCTDIFSNVMIKSNGDVIPAHGRCYNLTIGNLYSENLEGIWNSSTIARFRKTVTNEGGLLPACSRCCSGFIK